MNRRFLRHFVAVFTAGFFAAAAFWLESSGSSLRSPAPSRPPASVRDQRWVSLSGATLAESQGNDGDSFLIRHRGGEHVIRLYFVDSCEKRRYDLVRDRLADQGAYFGGLTEHEVIRLGREAREVVVQLLRERPIEVFTRWEPVYESPRRYGHVMVTEADGTKRALAEVLVARGLARIHTKGTDLPDGTSLASYQQRLRELERRARANRVGGWRHYARQDQRE